MTHDPLILMVAPNGARRTTADHEALPVTCEALVHAVGAAREAGAQMVHFHVRDEAEQHVLDIARYRDALAALRVAYQDQLILQVTTEAVGRYSPDEQMALVRALRPEAVSMALRELMPDYQVTDAVRAFFDDLYAMACWPHYILYDEKDVAFFLSLRAEGLIREPRPFVLFVLGRYARDQRSQPEDLDPFLAAMGERLDDVVWMVCAFGAQEAAAIGHAARHGGHGRIGFENNLFLPDGTRAPDNAALVHAARVASGADIRPLMSIDDLRAGIKTWMGW